MKSCAEAQKITFEELWDLVWESAKLPSIANEFLPKSLSKTTKKMMIESGLSPTEIATIIETSVDKINHGSVESIDTLINKYGN